MLKTKITIETAFSSVKEYFKESHRLSPLAFYCELCETTLVCGASAILTYTVLNPALSHTSYFDIIDYRINKDNTIISTGRILSIEPIKKNMLD